MKHRIIHTVQKYLLNPPIKLALAMGLPLPGYALLENKGTEEREATPHASGRWTYWKPFLAGQLPSSAGNARAVRLFGTQLLTVRIDFDS